MTEKPIIANCKLNIIEGPHKGSSFKVVSNQLTIGRSQTNDIVLKNDTQVSRNHIKIFLYKSQIWIQKMSKQNSVYVDDHRIESQILFNGNVIRIGQTKIQFVLEMRGAQETPQGKSDTTVPPVEEKTSFLRPLLIGIVILVLVASGFLSNTDKSKKTAKNKLPTINTENNIQENLSYLEKKITEKVTQRKINNLNSINFQLAEQNYIRGFREYRQGSFKKALESFQGCLSVDSKHKLCKTYYKMTKRKIDQLIQYYMTHGNRNLAKKRYKYCLSSFNNVKYFIGDLRNSLYQEADKKIQLCNLELKK